MNTRQAPFEVVLCHVDLIDPSPTRATAFVVMNELIVQLRLRGTRADEPVVHRHGSMDGGRNP